MRRPNLRFFWFLAMVAFTCPACAGTPPVNNGDPQDPGSDDPPKDDDPPVAETAVVRYAFAFSGGEAGWRVGFADYFAAMADELDLTSSWQQLPEPLADRNGLFVSGNNKADDLFMFIKHRISGFTPSRAHAFEFTVTFSTNAPANCEGIGGSPGLGVAVKAGAAAREPLAVVADENGGPAYRMNVDKGDQSGGGRDALSIGDFGNSRDCETGDIRYEIKTLTTGPDALTTTTTADGDIWVFFGTDSGYEGVTGIYYLGGAVTATMIRNP